MRGGQSAARPRAGAAAQHMYNSLASVFAGADTEATNQAPGYFTGRAPSSPSVALLHNGELSRCAALARPRVHMLPESKATRSTRRASARRTCERSRDLSCTIPIARPRRCAAVARPRPRARRSHQPATWAELDAVLSDIARTSQADGGAKLRILVEPDELADVHPPPRRDPGEAPAGEGPHVDRRERRQRSRRRAHRVRSARQRRPELRAGEGHPLARLATSSAPRPGNVRANTRLRRGPQAERAARTTR